MLLVQNIELAKKTHGFKKVVLNGNLKNAYH
jgi:hypothetical protein